MQGFNKYYPPDWKPDDGSLNKYHGKHALGDRARKLDKGILIIRFELPFNIWCGSCDNHIGQGVRYNAEKSKVGNYHSTPIWNFRCKCHLCQNWFEIRTDPQNTRYVVHSGARQKNEEWDPAENGGVVLDAKSDTPPNPFTSLERTVTQKARALTAAAHLHALEEDRSSQWSDPYAASSALRSIFRKKKKVIVESEGKAEGVREKYGLGERVSVESLRTPAREEDREEERREWGIALEERRKREGVSGKKRAREEEQVGWKSEGDRTRGKLGHGGVSRPVKSLPSKSKTSDAVKALSQKLGLASALKRDPFGLGNGAVSAAKESRRDSKVKVASKRK